VTFYKGKSVNIGSVREDEGFVLVWM